MALKAKGTVQTNLEAAIASINTALEDDTNVGNIADPLKPAIHPLRDINQLITINPATGQFTLNTVFFDSAYDRGVAYSTRKNQINIP